MAVAWEIRRKRWGPTGLSPDGTKKIRELAALNSARMWQIRRERYGPSGMSPQVLIRFREKQRAAALRRAKPKPPSVALVPSGLSWRQRQARLSWAIRHERYGSSGMTPAALARLKAAQPRLAEARRKVPKIPKCHRGHRFTTKNTRVYNGKRYCKACAILRAHRERRKLAWKAHIQRLKMEMIQAHPDKGGSERAFHLARRRLQRALARLKHSA